MLARRQREVAAKSGGCEAMRVRACSAAHAPHPPAGRKRGCLHILQRRLVHLYQAGSAIQRRAAPSRRLKGHDDGSDLYELR